MGTPHLTSVIHNKQKKIVQYGQWDGYPSTAAYALCKSIKNIGISKLRQILERVEPEAQTEESTTETVPSALDWETCDEIASFVDAIENVRINSQISKKPIQVGDSNLLIDENSTIKDAVTLTIEKFGLDASIPYFMWTRDVGYHILDVLSTFYEHNPEAVIRSYLDDDKYLINYIVNLDEETFTIKRYRCKRRQWSFDRLPELHELRKLDRLVY